MTTKKDIEEKAINCLKLFLEDSETISPYVSENDKEPCWDGHFYLYQPGHKDVKSHLVKRVPVQVKGHEVKDIIKDFKYKLDRADLQAYLKEPTIFIVCQEKINSKERQLCYIELLPTTVREILTQMGTKSSRRVRFRPLPDDIHEVEQIIEMFAAHSLRMTSFANQPLPTFPDAIKDPENKLVCVTPHGDILQSLCYLSSHDIHPYVKEKTFGITIPLNVESFRMTFIRNVHEDVSAGGKVYFHEYTNSIENGMMKINIGNIIHLTYHMDGDTPAFHSAELTNHAGTLEENIFNTDFALAVLTNQEFNVGTTPVKFAPVDQTQIDGLTKMRDRCVQLKQILDDMHVDKPLDITRITDADEYKIDMLIEGILNKKPLKLDMKNGSTFLIIDIANITLLCWCLKLKDGNYLIGDYFAIEIEVKYGPDENDRIEATQYSYLREYDLWQKVDNIDYDRILESAERAAKKDERYFNVAADDVSIMLQAAKKLKKKDPDRSAKLLSGAKSLNQYLIQRDRTVANKQHLKNHLKISQMSPS